MISTVHMMTGAAVAVVTGEWWLAGVLGPVLHFLEDMVPHRDPSLQTWPLRQWLIAASLDFLVGIILVLFFMGDRISGILVFTVFMSIMPDVLSIIDYFFPTKIGEKYRQWHKTLQRENHGWLGIVTQVLVLIVMITIVRN